MSNISVYDELDQAIDQMLSAPEVAHAARETEIGELLELAHELARFAAGQFQVAAEAGT